MREERLIYCSVCIFLWELLNLIWRLFISIFCKDLKSWASITSLVFLWGCIQCFPYVGFVLHATGHVVVKCFFFIHLIQAILWQVHTMEMNVCVKESIHFLTKELQWSFFYPFCFLLPQDKDQESLLKQLHSLSDALEFQQNEIKNARDIVRSIKAKLVIMEGKVALEVMYEVSVIWLPLNLSLLFL